MSTAEGNDNALVAATDKMKELSHEDSDESRSREESKDLEVPDRFITHNIGHFNGAYNNELNTEKLTRSQVLETYLQKRKPLMLNLNEIMKVSREEFQDFADKVGYTVLAIDYPGRIEKADGTDELTTIMARAAAILVRKDSGRNFETILAAKKDNSYTIVGVRDMDTGTNHFCCYIHNTINKSKLKAQLTDALTLVKETIYIVVTKDLQRKTRIGLDASKFSDIDKAIICEEVKKEKVVVSGDLNLDIDSVNDVLSTIDDFVSLEDKLYFKWPTRKVDEISCSKIDFLLAANVYITAHKPVKNFCDHHTLIWDINRAPTAHANCDAIQCDLDTCAEPSLLDVTIPEQDADRLLTHLVSLFLAEAAEQKTIKSVTTHYSEWRARVAQMMHATAPSLINGLILPHYLDDKVFGSESRKKHRVSKLDQNKLNWICAISVLVEELKSVEMRGDGIRSSIDIGRMNAISKAKKSKGDIQDTSPTTTDLPSSSELQSPSTSGCQTPLTSRKSDTPILHSNIVAEQRDEMSRSHSLVDQTVDDDERETPNVRRRCNTHHAAFLSESTTHLIGVEDVQLTASDRSSSTTHDEPSDSDEDYDISPVLIYFRPAVNGVPTWDQLDEEGASEKYDFCSPTYKGAGNLEWYLTVGKSWTSNEHIDDALHEMLIVDIYCQNNWHQWRADAHLELRMVKSDGSKTTTVTEHVFTWKSDMARVILGSWHKFIDPREGFVGPDCKFHIEAKIAFRSLSGVVLPKMQNFSTPSRLSDAILLVEGRKLHVNKAILALASPFFEKKLYDESVDSGEISIEDVSYKKFSRFLAQVYSPSTPMTVANVETMLCMAKQFETETITVKAGQFLIDSEDFVFEKKMLMADQFNLLNLQGWCLGELDSMDKLKKLWRTTEYTLLSDRMKVDILDHWMSQQE